VLVSFVPFRGSSTLADHPQGYVLAADDARRKLTRSNHETKRYATNKMAPRAALTHLPLIIGHRGSSAIAPENTLAAFKQAFTDGAVGIEFDVRLSRDGVPVVIHDANLRRTGRRRDLIAALSAAELKQVDVGSWFNRAYSPLGRDGYPRERLPTLDETFFLLAKQRPKPRAIYVELKTQRAEGTSDDLAAAVIELIHCYSLHKPAVVVSFNLGAIAKVKELDPSIRTGALFEPKRSVIKAIRKHPMITAALDRGANQILLHRSIVSRRLVSLAREANLLPVVWTVDDPRWVSRATELGIHALITNNPAKMVERQLATEIQSAEKS
jgi:glycerophosphoryl diester phosphodiesterase